MSISHQDSNKVFPEFDLRHLEDYAEKWVKKYPKIHIDRVILHRVPTYGQEKFKEKKKGKTRETKYAVIFEFSNCNELSEKNIWEKVKSDYNELSKENIWKKVKFEPYWQKVNLKDLILAYRDMRRLIEQGQNIINADDECFKFFREVNRANENQKPHPLIDLHFFRMVYNERIPRGQNKEEDFRAEWYFDSKHIDDRYIETHLNLKNTPYIMLYPESSVLDSREHLNNEFENFIKSMKVDFENDNEVGVQALGKKRKTPNYKRFDFKNNGTKEWKNLIKILEGPEHKFHLGPAGSKGSNERKVYDSRRNILREISKKFLEFIRKEYSLQIPKKYKLYKKCPEEGPGVFKFKFSIVTKEETDRKLESKFKAYSDDDLKETIGKLAKKYKKTSDVEIVEKFVAVSKIALERKLLTESQIAELIERDKPKEEHIFVYNENVKDREPDY